MSRAVPPAAWFRASRRTLAAELSHGGWPNFGQFRWSDVSVLGGLRAGIGILIPMVVGLATSHLQYGVYAAFGAFPAGLMTFQGVSRTRLTAVAATALGMTAATFVGGVAAANGWWLLPAVMLFTYLTGLLVTLGQRHAVAGVQVSMTLLIASGIPLGPGDAALRAAVVLAGGLWQAALVVASWAFLPGGRERSSLAAVYRALGAYAEEHCARPSGAGPVPPPAAFGTHVLDDPNPLLRARDRAKLILLLEEAAQIRTSLAAVASYGSCAVLEPAAGVLGGLAGALEARRGRRERAAALEAAVAAIDLPQDVAGRWAGAGLLVEIRAAVRLLCRLFDYDDEPEREARAAAGPWRHVWRADLTAALFTLRASAGTSTEAGRHALRLAIVAAIGEIVAQASGLPFGYWIVLTIVLVLRPDYASTIYLGVQRAGGTVIGAGLGVATVLLLHAGPAALVVAASMTMTVAYAVLAVNYLVYAVFLTDFVVILLVLLGETAEQTAAARLVSTCIGAALALAGYLAWPSWGGKPAQQKIALLYETHGRYASLMLRAYARPGHADAAALRSAEITARRARSDAEVSASRLADEPPRPPMTTRLAYALTETARRMAHASLTLHAAVSAPPTGPGSEAASTGADSQAAASTGADGQAASTGAADIEAAVRRFADAVEVVTAAVAGSLRSLRPPGGLPPLREMQTILRNTLNGPGGSAKGAPGLAGPGTVLIDSTDEFTEALGTAAEILQRDIASCDHVAEASRQT